MGLREREPDAVTFGVVGCGYWGPNLIRNISENPRAKLTAIADLRQERLEVVGRRCPGARRTTDHDEVLGDPTIDAVAITTPVSTHFELGRAALEAGKHVIMAKPLASTVAEAERLIELAKEVERLLLVDHTFIYTGAVRKIRSLLEEGALGEPYYFDSVRVNLGLFQHDVNVVWDLAAHDLSILTHLFDAEPLSVAATGASHAGYGMEDVAYVTIGYEGDFIAHCHLNWLSPVKIRQTLIGGSERMLVWDDLDPDEKVKVYDRGIAIPEEDTGTERYYETIVKYRTGDCWIPQIERHEALGMEIDHFLDCIAGDAVPLTDGEFGRKVVELLEASSASLRDGGRPVTLDRSIVRQ